MTPFSGPSHRSCESATSRRQNSPRFATSLLDRRALDVRRKSLDRGHADLGAPTDRERQAVASEAVRMIGFQHDVRG